MVLADAPERSRELAGFDCEGGGGGGIRGASRDRRSTIRATTFDLAEGRQTGRFSAHWSGRRVLLLPLPMYFPAAHCHPRESGDLATCFERSPLSRG